MNQLHELVQPVPICFACPLILGLAVRPAAQHLREEQPGAGRQRLNGADVAREILDSNGLQNVPVQPSKAGPLSDHFDPRSGGVFLSEVVFAGRSVAATAVAAHEAGHAIQHAKAYAPMTLRSAVWPVAAFGSQAWFFILIAGVIFQAFAGLKLALVVFGCASSSRS